MEVQEIFKSVKLRFTEAQLDAFMSTMSFESDDLVRVSDFRKEGERHQIGKRAPEKQQDNKAKKAKTLSSKKRYFGHENIFKFIGRTIVKEKLINIGSSLKGQDFCDFRDSDGNYQEGYISRSNFFDTIWNIPHFNFHTNKDGLMEGDIMDMMNVLDNQKTGYIELIKIRDMINECIPTDQSNFYVRIPKVSIFQVVCEEEVVEQTGDQGKIIELQLVELDKAMAQKPGYIKALTVETLAALSMRQNDMDLSDYLDNFSRTVQGQVSLEGFSAAMVKLIRITGSQIKAMYKFLMAKNKSEDFQKLQRRMRNDEITNEEVGTQVTLIKNRDQIDCSKIEEYFQEIFPLIRETTSDREKFVEFFIIEIVEKISYEYLPLNDIVDLFRMANQNDVITPAGVDPNNIPMDDFTDQILKDKFKIEQIMTDVKCEVLADAYRNPQEGNFVEIDRFLQDLFGMDDRMRQANPKSKRPGLCMNEEEADNLKFELGQDAMPGAKQTGGMKGTKRQVQIDYIVRSGKNTYMTEEGSAKMGEAWLNPTADVAGYMRDIMLRTRAYGKSVECYFQQFQDKQGNELSKDKFWQGLKALDLDWVDDKALFEFVYQSLDYEESGYVSLDEIAKAVMDCVAQDMTDFENNYLEKAYSLLQEKGKLANLKPHIVFLNSKRDFTCSVQEFVALFRQSFDIGEDDLETWKIQIIMQRYGISPENKNPTLKKGKMYERYAKPLIIFFYGLIADLGCRNMGVEFRYIPFMHLAECITKRMRIQRIEDANFGIYLSRFANSRDIISNTQFVKACLSLGIEREFSVKQIEQMLAKIGVSRGTVQLGYPTPQMQQPGGYSHPFNTIDSGQGTTPQVQINYSLNSVQEGFKKLVKKSEANLFNDTLNIVYIVSKRLEMYQRILTLFTEVDELDGSKDGHVKPSQFVDIITSALKTDSINDSAHWKDFKLFKINSIDVEHLAFKYMNLDKNFRGSKEEMEKVYYDHFYKNYDQLEKDGLADRITGLEQDQKKKGTKKDGERADPFFKFQIPDKYLKFYGILSREIERQSRRRQFYQAFLDADRTRVGFLSNAEVHQCFTEVGIKLNKKQVAQVTYPLHQKAGAYSWPELIELMFGKQEWLDLKVRSNLKNMYSLTEQEDEQLGDCLIGEKLQKQIEYKYADLLVRQLEETHGQNMLQEDQFIEIFEQVGIRLTEQDKMALYSFFESHKSLIATINVQDLFNFYGMTNRMSVCLKKIQMFFTAKEERQIDANKALQGKGRFDFKAIIELLKKSKFDLLCITQTYLQEAQKDEPGPVPEDLISNLTQKQYPLEFLDLYDIFLVNQEGGEEGFIKKANLMALFAIEFREVEASEKEDSKRSGSARDGDQSRRLTQRQKVYDKKQLDAMENVLRSHIGDPQHPSRKTIVSKIQDKTLTKEQFKELLSNKLGFDLAQRDRFSILCQVFAAKPEKGSDQKLISVPLLKEKMGANINLKEEQEKEKRRTTAAGKKKPDKAPTKKPEPGKTTGEMIKDAEMKQDPGQFNQKTKDILAAVNTFLKQNRKGDKERLFKEMDKNNDGSVDQKEFVTYFTRIQQNNTKKGKDQSEVDRALNPQSLADLFKALDCDGSQSLDLGEFVKYIGYADELEGKIRENIDDDTIARIEHYIGKLFRQVDRDKSGFVDLDELYNLLKPTNPGTFNKAKCQQIIERFDANSDGVLDEEEFHKVVQSVISESLTNPNADFEDWKKKFRLQDKDKDGQLTVEEFKTMITETLKVKAISSRDLETLVAWIDQDGDRKIPIGEFFELLSNNAQINYEPSQDMIGSEQSDNNQTVKKCLFAIRSAMSIDLFEYFAVQCANALPDFFEPSFLQNIIEKGGKNMPSQGLISLSDKPDKNKIDYTNTGALPVFPLPEKSTFQLTLQDIDNVPVPVEQGGKDGKFELKDIHSREVRIVLFDNVMGQYISNTQIVPASGSKDGKKWTFEFSEAIKLARSFTFKCDQEFCRQRKDVEVRFELVLTLKKTDGKDYQYTNGWGSLSVTDLYNKSKGDVVKVKLTGGSPVNHAEIDSSQVQPKNVKSKGFFGKKDTEDPNSFFLNLEVDPVQVSKLEDLEKGCLFSLPYDFIINTSLVSFYAGIAAYCSQLKADSGPGAPSSVLSDDLLLTALHKYFDCTDLNVLMGACWKLYYSPEESKEQQESGSILGKIVGCQRAMQSMVLEIYESIHEVNPDFVVDPIYPTRSSKLSAEGFGAQEAAFMEKMIRNKISMTDDVAEKTRLQGIVDKIVKDHKPRALKGEGEDFLLSGANFQQFSMSDVLEEVGEGLDELLQKHEGQVAIMK